MANDEEHTPDFEDLLAAYDISDASIESSNLRNGTDHRVTPTINMNFLKEMAFAETQSEACKRATPIPSSEKEYEITVVENGVVEVRKKPLASDESCFTMQRNIVDLSQAKQSKPKKARKNISTSCSRPLAAPIQKQVKTVVVKARKTVKTLDPKPRANPNVYKRPASNGVSKSESVVQLPSASVRLNGTEIKAEEEEAITDDDDQVTEDVTTQLYTNALSPYSPCNDGTEFDHGVWANAPTEGGFTCLDCGDRFLLETSLTDHLQRRSVHISLNCASCETKLVFYNRCALLSHVRMHRQMNQNVDLSETTFGPLSLDLLQCVGETKARVVTEKNLEANSTYRCYECDRYCGSSLSLEQHFGCSQSRPSKNVHCEQCDMSCQSKCSLTSHRRIHVQKKPFVCPECGQTFVESWDVFHLHLTTVCLHLSRTTGFKCGICDTLTVTAVELRDHIVKCHSQSYYKCKECPMAFKSAVSFNAHRTSVHKTSDVQCLTICKCPLCDVLSQNSGGLQAHLDDHVSELDKKIQFLFRCNVCKVLFEDKMTLSGHLKQTHPSVFKVRCKICRAAFRHNNLLRDHIQRKHPESLTDDDEKEKSKSVEATTTQKVDVKQRNLTNEEEQMEEEVSKANKLSKTTCKQCSQNFPSIRKLRLHRQRSHTAKDVRHRCVVCQEHHPDPESIARHGHIHLDAGLHVCTLCNNLSFATKLGLSRHLDHHASNFSYPLDCVYCGQKLTDVTTAADHWKSEHLVYEFSCDQCDAQYLHKNSLTRHVKQMHPIADKTKYYPCSICEGFDFPKRSLLVQHLESTHGISSVDIDLSQLIPKPSLPSKSKKVATVVSNQPRSSPPPRTSSPPPSKVKTIKERRSSDDEPLRKPKKFKQTEEEEEKEEVKVTRKGYFCAKCGHRAKTKSEFLDHIQVHKTERNLYQCLECGICFVVEPSLRKHLSFTHKIKDVDRFMEENGYSVTGGRSGLQRNHNGTGPSTSSSSAAKSPAMAVDPYSVRNVSSADKVFECEVCYNTFETDLSLRTHMRTHGMAFIKIKRISNVPVNEVNRSKPQTQFETNKSP